MLLRRAILALACLAAFSAFAACKGGKETTTTGTTSPTSSASGTGGTGTGGTGGTGGGVTCPSGQVAGADGGCLTVGVQGCAAIFVDPDGLCRPSLAKCPAGTIPDFATGCVPVGIPGCAAAFVGTDGLCHPAMSMCPAGTYALPQKGCVPIDGPDGCGTGTWGNIPIEATNVYVDPSYAGGDGDGSMAKPVTTIAGGLALVQAGGRVALAAGMYEEAVAVQTPVEIAGRCPSMVTIVGTNFDEMYPVVVWIAAAPSTLRGVTVTGAGVGVEAVASATIDTVHVTAAAQSAFLAGVGAETVTFTNCFAEGTLAAPNGEYGTGLSAESAVAVTITDSAFYQNRAEGVFAYGAGTSITMSDVLVDTTVAEDSDQLYGEAAVVADGATMNLSAVALVAGTVTGVVAEGTGTVFTATGILVEGTLPQATDMTQGQGVTAANGAALSLLSSVVMNNENVGVFAYGPFTKLDLSGNLIAGTKCQASDGTHGDGVDVQGSAIASLFNDAMSMNHQAGIGVHEMDTRVTVVGDVIEDTLAQDADGQYGMGTIVGTGVLSLTSVTIARSRVAAVFVEDGSAVVEASLLMDTADGDVTVGTPPQTLTSIGDGLSATEGAFVTVKAARIEGCARAGLVFDSSQGSVTGVSATMNQFGLVLDGTPLPKVDKASSFAGNGQSQADDAALPVPSAPADVPTQANLPP
jgi:hypothetical protein